MSIRLTPLHLLGSNRSLLFGTNTTLPSCHSSKFKLSFQNSRMKLKWTFRFSGDMALKTLGGTTFSPGSLSLVRSFTSSVNYFQEVGKSSSFKTSREFMLFKTLLLILFLLFNIFPKCFANTLALSLPFQQGLLREASFEIVLEMCDELSPFCTEYICFPKHPWDWTTSFE